MSNFKNKEQFNENMISISNTVLEKKNIDLKGLLGFSPKDFDSFEEYLKASFEKMFEEQSIRPEVLLAQDFSEEDLALVEEEVLKYQEKEQDIFEAISLENDMAEKGFDLKENGIMPLNPEQVDKELDVFLLGEDKETMINDFVYESNIAQELDIVPEIDSESPELSESFDENHDDVDLTQEPEDLSEELEDNPEIEQEVSKKVHNYKEAADDFMQKRLENYVRSVDNSYFAQNGSLRISSLSKKPGGKPERVAFMGSPPDVEDVLFGLTMVDDKTIRAWPDTPTDLELLERVFNEGLRQGIISKDDIMIDKKLPKNVRDVADKVKYGQSYQFGGQLPKDDFVLNKHQDYKLFDLITSGDLQDIESIPKEERPDLLTFAGFMKEKFDKDTEGKYDFTRSEVDYLVEKLPSSNELDKISAASILKKMVDPKLDRKQGFDKTPENQEPESPKNENEGNVSDEGQDSNDNQPEEPETSKIEEDTLEFDDDIDFDGEDEEPEAPKAENEEGFSPENEEERVISELSQDINASAEDLEEQQPKRKQNNRRKNGIR